MADDPNEDPENPFRGTPFEDMFHLFGGQQPNMGSMMSQFKRFMEPYEGSVNYRLAQDTARQALAAQGPDPSPHAGQRNAVQDALQLAEMWLDRATDLPAGASHAIAWSRAEWIEQTMSTWQVLVEPIAAHAVTSMGEALPADAKAMLGPIAQILTQAGGAMFGQQLGSGLGELATSVLSSTDIGFPLGPDRTAALLPHNIAGFAEGLEATDADVLLHVMLREAAHHRLFAHATWLRPALVGAIEDFGRGTHIDVSAIEEKFQGFDPSNPTAIQEALSEGVFEPQATPEQQRATERLELLLALIEGWVDEVVMQATAERMPAAPALAEAMRRRRATGGPAEEAFATLVGLELRPRRLRDAAALWGALRDRNGAAARDAVWSHPDLLPTSTDLDDPLGFGQGEPEGMSDAEFDEALGKLLDEDDEGNESGAPS